MKISSHTTYTITDLGPRELDLVLISVGLAADMLTDEQAAKELLAVAFGNRGIPASKSTGEHLLEIYRTLYAELQKGPGGC